MVSSQPRDRSKHSFLMPSHGFAFKQMTLALTTVYIRILATTMNFPAPTGPSGVCSSPLELNACFNRGCQTYRKPLRGHLSAPRTQLIRGDKAYIPKGKPVYPRLFRGATVENTPETRARAALWQRNMRGIRRPISPCCSGGKSTVEQLWSTRCAGRYGR
jgi:hypothetical protein